MEKLDVNKLTYRASNLTFPYNKLNGGTPFHTGTNLGENYWTEYFSVANNTNDNGSFSIEVTGWASSKCYTRTVYFMSGTEPAK